jgi:hypothetical protein
METLYLKIKVKRTDKLVADLRDQGLLFDFLASSLSIKKEQIEEIDNTNLLANIKALIEDWA